MGHFTRFAGFRMLVVGDEGSITMIADDFPTDPGITVERTVTAAGLAVAPEVHRTIDGAILDVNLGGERLFPIAGALVQPGIAFAFATGYGPPGLAPRYAAYPAIGSPFGLRSFEQILLPACT